MADPDITQLIVTTAGAAGLEDGDPRTGEKFRTSAVQQAVDLSQLALLTDWSQ